MSANSAVTVLRSPSGTSLGSAATRMLDAPRLDAPALGEPWAESEPPNLPKNLNEGFFPTPLGGHWAKSPPPQPPQNLFPTGFSTPHFEQRISASPLCDPRSVRMLDHAPR